MASVIELAGRETDEVTFNAPTFALAMLELEMVVVLNVVVAKKEFWPVKLLLPFMYAKFAVSERFVEAMPVTEEPVNARVPVTVKLPTFAEAMLEVTNVVELVNKNWPEALNVLPENCKYGVPVTVLMLLYTVTYPWVEVPTAPPPPPPLPQPLQLTTERLVKKAFVEVMLVEVMLVNTPVDGVFAPIGVLSIVPPLIVSASAILLSPSEPVIEPKLPRANVTLALPNVPEFTAVAETLPVASMVNVLETIASVIEFAGSATELVTFNAPIFADAIEDDEIVVVLNVVVAKKELRPVND
jgi:hypothetical protein